MIKIAFCDDDISVLNELRALLDKYRVERNQKIEYTSFNSPLELLSEVEKALLEQYGYTKVRFTIHFWLCEINQGNQRVKLATPSGTEVDRWSFDNTPPRMGHL